MIFRDATIEDLPVIVDIYNSTIPSGLVTADTEPVSVEDKLNWFHEHGSSNRPLWVACENDAIIGWISFSDFYGRPAYDGTAEISIYIKEEFRRQGFGKRMLSHSMDQCSKLHIHTLLGFIFEQNTDSLKLFHNLGFEEWGHLKDIAELKQGFCSLKILGFKFNPTQSAI